MIGEVAGVVACDAGGVNEQDAGADGLVGSAGGDNAFDDENVFGGGLDAGAEDLLEAHGGHAAAGENDGVAFGGFDDGGKTLVAGSPTAVALLALDEVAVGEGADDAFDLNGGAVQGIRLAADAETDGLAGAGGEAGGGGFRIVEDHEDVENFLAEEFGEKDGRVSGAAGADVVADVHQRDGAVGGTGGLGDGFGRGGEGASELVAPLPGAGGEVAGGAAGEGGVVVGDGEEGSAHFGDVGVVEAEGDAGGEDAGPGEDVGEIVVEGAGGQDGGLLAGDVDEQGRGFEGLDGADFATEGAKEEMGGFLPAGALVEVRVGAIGDGGVGEGDHLGGDVGVEVEGGDDGEVGAGGEADAAEKFAVGIGVGFADGGAVEGEEEAVEGAGVSEVDEELGGDAFVGGGGDGAAGDGEGGEEGHHFEGRLVFRGRGLEDVEEAAEFVMGVGPAGEQGRSTGEAGVHEVVVGGGDGEEGVGFVEEAGDGDAEGAGGFGHWGSVRAARRFSDGWRIT